MNDPRQKFVELLSKLNSLNLPQLSCWDEDIPEEIYNEYFTTHTTMATGLHPEEHRWYRISTTVVEVYGSLLGIRHVDKMFSENDSLADAGFTYDFSEMEEIRVISYRKHKPKTLQKPSTIHSSTPENLLCCFQ